MRLMLTYDNGHIWERAFPDLPAAYAYANDCVCLTNGKIVAVDIEMEPGSVLALWAAHWTPASKMAGMTLPE